MPQPRWPSRLALTLLFTVSCMGVTGCFQYRQQSFETTPAPACPDFSRGCSKTVWGFVWGAVYAGQPAAAECGSGGLAEVTVRNNPAYFLLTLVTVGLVSPQHVEWKCAAPAVTPGELPSGSAGTD